VSWRWAGRRPSVRRYGVFLKSEAEQRRRAWTASLKYIYVYYHATPPGGVGVTVPVMMSSRTPSFPSRTWGFTCLFFSSAIRSTCGILGPWKRIETRGTKVDLELSPLQPLRGWASRASDVHHRSKVWGHLEMSLFFKGKHWFYQWR